MYMYRACIIAVAKDEEKYIQEWYDWTINAGFEHIFLGDNNPVDNPLTFNAEKLTIIPMNGIQLGVSRWALIDAYNKLFQYVKNYDYVMILDIDEFIEFDEGINDISDYIQQECEDTRYYISEIPWVTYDDNDIIYEKDLITNSVVASYPRQQQYLFKGNGQTYAHEQKTICKIYPQMDHLCGNNIQFPDQQWYDAGLFKPFKFAQKAKIRHYRTKCLETYIRHKSLQQLFGWMDYEAEYNWMLNYFLVNSLTMEKVRAMQKIIQASGTPLYMPYILLLERCANMGKYANDALIKYYEKKFGRTLPHKKETN